DVRPVRRRLPKQRPATVTRFSVAGAEGYMTASSYPDDGVGEVFLKLGKQGSTLAGVMDAFSMAISISLQYGVPLEKWVEKFTNMRFEPAGVTDDPDIRIASSVMDYVFRRLALDHLPYETRAELGILSAAERTAQLAGEDPAGLAEDQDTTEMAQSAPVERPQPAREADDSQPEGPAVQAQQPPAQPHSSMEVLEMQPGRTAVGARGGTRGPPGPPGGAPGRAGRGGARRAPPPAGGAPRRAGPARERAGPGRQPQREQAADGSPWDGCDGRGEPAYSRA